MANRPDENASETNSGAFWEPSLADRGEGGRLTAPFHQKMFKAAERLAGDENRGIVRLGQRIHRFLHFNRARLGQTYEGLDQEQRLVFSAIPYLLHVNQPEFPGYIDSSVVVHGIHRMEFNSTIRRSVETLFRLDQVKPAESESRPVIRSVFVSSNVGTLAQRDKDSVVFFLVTDVRSMGEAVRHQLRTRTDAIASWARKLGLTVHFVLVDPVWSAKGDFGPLRDVPARGMLVLERFYRTVTFIAGEIPVFWATTPGGDAAKYSRTARMVARVDFDQSLGFVDLGHVELPPVRVRRRAMLALLNHDANSPLTVFLDLVLLVYGANASSALCEHLKSRVFKQADVPDFLDPFLLLFDAAAIALAHHGQWDELRLLQRVLLLKLGMRSLRLSSGRTAFLRLFSEVRPFVSRWGWDKDILESAEQVCDWSQEGVAKIDGEIRAFILGLYRQLSESARATPGRFDEEEVALLGRRIIGAFGHMSGQVSLQFNYLLHESRGAECFVFLDRSDKPRRERWAIYRRTARREPIEGESPLWVGDSVAAGATWAAVNGLFLDWTDVRVASKDSIVTSAVAKELLERITQLTEGLDPLVLPTHYFAGPRLVRRAMLVVNFEGTRVESGASVGDKGHYLPSNWDVLNYGRTQESHVKDLSVLTLDTWDEVFCRHLRGRDAVRNAIRLVYGGLDPDQPLETTPEIVVPEGRTNRAVNDRFRQLLTAIDEVVLGPSRDAEERIFAYEAGGRFQVLRRTPDRVNVVNARSLSGVIRLLSPTEQVRQIVRLDSLSPTLGDLRGLFERQQSDPGLEICVGWRRLQEGGYFLVCDDARRVYLRSFTTQNFEDHLLRLLRRIIHHLRDRVRDMRTLRKVLRVFELKDGTVQGDQSHLYEDTVRVLRLLGDPRKTSPQLFLRGRFEDGRDGLYIEYNDQIFGPEEYGRSFACELIKKMTEDRDQYAQFGLHIEASTVEFEKRVKGKPEKGIVRHLKLIDLYERLLARALKSVHGKPSPVMTSRNSFSRRAET